nr:MAG TPA: hypothetical protein [Caudoviricetes sp.]
MSLTIPHSIMSLVSCAYSPRFGFQQRKLTTSIYQ